MKQKIHIAIGDLRTNKSFLGLLLVFTAGLLITIVCAFYQSRTRIQDERYLQLATQQQILSERLSALTFEAVHGDSIVLQNHQTFAQLEQAVSQFNEATTMLSRGDVQTGLPAAPGDLQQRVLAVNQIWVQAQAQLRSIINNKDILLGARTYQTEFIKLVPNLLADLQNLTEQARANGNVAQTAFLLQLTVYLERIREQSLNMGDGSASSAAQILLAKLNSLHDGLQMLAKGGREIAPLPDAGPARVVLNRILLAYPRLEEQVEYIAGNSQQLISSLQAMREFANQANVLQKELDLQQRAFQILDDDRWIKSGTVTTFGVITLLALAALLYLLTQRIRELLAQAQAQNDRNQNAILRLLDEMENLAHGDLGVRATVSSDITGAIADSMNYAIEALRELVQTINVTAESVASAAGESQQIASSLIQASERQAQQINSATGAIGVMARSIEQVSQHAQRSNDVAQHSVQMAAKGNQMVRRTIDGMDVIREQIQETAKRLKRLGESSQEIGDIVELINDIAEQTNILALNAAIQASAAGEAGRGFAVVADEVQRLAERSTHATKQIEALVRTIQGDTHEAMSSMERSTSGVVQGAKLAEDAGDMLGEIETISSQIASLVQSISDAARQQTGQANEVAGNMQAIQEITRQTAEGTRATGEAVSRLAKLATNLRQSVAGFKLPDTSFTSRG